MKIENLKPFDGQHCETTATGTLLKQIGIELTEPMLFGIGEGLSYIYWNMKTMDFPFIGGRIKPDLLTQNICKNLGLELKVKETSSQKKAWDEVKQYLDNGQAVGLKLDCYYLNYFSNPFHFAGHYAAIYGYDNENAFLIDTRQQGGQVKTSLESLALARAAKGPMASKNLYYSIKKNKGYDFEKVISKVIKNNAEAYLNPPIMNVAYKGILKTSFEILKWFNTGKNIEQEFKMSAMLMEKAGTGGALFRNLYRDFLQQSYELLQLNNLKTGYESFIEIAELWTSVSRLFEKVSETKDVRYIHQAADVLKAIADKEKRTMELLASL
ncbi:BtrH N-terminal domain-containing protein [Elizabethkingia meningoseptica]|uniref:BtrH N-terminal domain-containing protein n=1 Tax=Elizabethkingia meningoseptica TaxID=238 RepID=UPI0020135BDD|nr:BtrH N-terminal domain-containing protein [Elizabethkingia meningoseptica]MCL1676720.1 BtrH N-terminal domain-containing protein [Elizabethkingia meningoseptica]MCL1686675.1 BtrH N-terminal domain-containing protein [Elizabethkingia meningoseptica]